MEFQDAVVMILTLMVFTGILFCPSPELASLNATGSVTPAPGLPQPDAARDLSSVLTGIEERLLVGHPLNLTVAPTPKVADDPAVTGGNATRQEENTTVVTPKYDNDKLIGLVENNSVSLMLLSVQSAHALYAWDEESAKKNTASLQAFAKGVLRDSKALKVSGDRKDMKTAFTRALESYIAAGETLQGNAPLNRTRVDTALEEVQRGSTYLREAFESLDHPVLPMPEKIVEIDLSSPRSHAPPDSGDWLVLLERYVYEDQSRANDISLILESVKATHAYHLQGGQAVVAEPGRMFLLIEVKVTNLGHKGDNRVYKIQTPGINAFTLHCRGTTYSPVKLVPWTSLGEPYGAATLDRYEKKSGYIVFNVPEALNIDECFVQVNLGGGDTPTWAIGKTL